MYRPPNNQSSAKRTLRWRFHNHRTLKSRHHKRDQRGSHLCPGHTRTLWSKSPTTRKKKIRSRVSTEWLITSRCSHSNTIRLKSLDMTMKPASLSMILMSITRFSSEAPRTSKSKMTKTPTSGTHQLPRRRTPSPTGVPSPEVNSSK